MQRKYLSTLILSLIIVFSCSQKSQDKLPKKIQWSTDIEAATALAKLQDKPMMIDFMATWCPPCNMMEDSTFNQPEIIKKSLNYITVRIDVDQQKEVAEKFGANARKYGGIGIPNILFMDSGGFRFRHIIGYQSPEKLSAVMDTITTRYEIQKEKQ